MSEQLNSSNEQSNVIPLRRREPVEVPRLPMTERINGIAIKLGRLSVEELRTIEQTCLDRLEEARTDVYVVRDYLWAAEMQALESQE